MQKQVILEAINKKPDAIILVASDYYEIAPYAKKIANEGIKLVLLDSDVDVTFDYKETYIGTNSKKAGQSLAEIALKQTDGLNKNAIILAHQIGVQTSDDRESGIKDGYGEENILSTYSCKSSEDVAYSKTIQAITDDDSIVNIFCTNENVTIGAARAIEEMGLNDRINIYGFDGSKEHIEYLEKGILNCTIIQSPYQMGYLSVEAAVDVLNGKKIPQFIETDFLLIDIDNMYEIGYREILFPFIE
jgi:ribose transport system substrate-binding protein